MIALALGVACGGFFAGMLLWGLLFRSASMLWTAFRHSGKSSWRYGVLPFLLIFNPLPWLLIVLPWLTAKALSGHLPVYWTWFFVGVYAAFALFAVIMARLVGRWQRLRAAKAGAAAEEPAAPEQR